MEDRPVKIETSKAKRVLRVLFVHDHLGYPNGVIHGVTTYFRSILPGFDPNEVQYLLCINRSRHPVADTLEAAGIRPVFFDRGKWDVRVLWDLVKLIRQRNIDVLHLTGMKGILLGRIAGWLTGRPAVIHFHDTDRGWCDFMQRRLAKWTRWAIGVCEPVRQFAIQEYGLPPEKVEVLHNGIAIEQFERLDQATRFKVRDELELPHSVPVIGMFGRFFTEKGQHVLLNAFPKILARRPETRLLMVGDGETRASCEQLCRMLDITAAVRFTGHRKDVAELMSAVDLVAVPSMWEEPLPYVALEALCAGRAVVAFRVGGIPELIIDGETGLLVPKGDTDGLTHALLRLIDDESLRERIAERGRQHAQAFTVQRHVQRLTEIYRMVAAPVSEQPGQGILAQAMSAIFPRRRFVR
jgi:glycosyltransferase involved in cell wall biosynthesis